MAAPGTDKWLERVFSARSNEAVTRTYDEWAAGYDTHIVSIGYANPVLPAWSLATFPHLTPRFLMLARELSMEDAAPAGARR